MILLASLFSPLVELFPNLYMSWWLPSNGKIQAYLKAWWRRIAVVLTVWVPILYTLGKFTSLSIQIAISVLVFSAFGLRLLLFDRALHDLSDDETEFTPPSTIPEVFYFIAFTSIGVILFNAVPSMPWLVPVGILLIFLGANMMGTFRRGAKKNLNLDVLGRVVFTIGFLTNLYNVARAAAII